MAPIEMDVSEHFSQVRKWSRAPHAFSSLSRRSMPRIRCRCGPGLRRRSTPMWKSPPRRSLAAISSSVPNRIGTNVPASVPPPGVLPMSGGPQLPPHPRTTTAYLRASQKEPVIVPLPQRRATPGYATATTEASRRHIGQPGPERLPCAPYTCRVQPIFTSHVVRVPVRMQARATVQRRRSGQLHQMCAWTISDKEQPKFRG